MSGVVMHRLRLWILVLLFTSVGSSEARLMQRRALGNAVVSLPITTAAAAAGGESDRSAEMVYEGSKRRIPGGPDPQHH
ncbi:hypothetical protein MUK42_14834 [Musa troglodytarum]|uniref:Uncharacterized protein n=1 Tax=Musa troglodytarum TaxID=320322 RepID=A0A9E7IFX9_9LILI|nr:hypothetical protein MUK42_14834 [Musa troglodytarum]